MLTPGFSHQASSQHYDVVIIGGAIMGSSLAWWLTELAPKTLKILVVERDPTFAKASTALSNSCMRLQFSSPLNIEISKFCAEFITDLPRNMRGDSRIPKLSIQNFGYLYLADTQEFAQHLKSIQPIQREHGAETELLTPEKIAERYPYFDLQDILLGAINRKSEGYWDGYTVFEWFRRQAREAGADYVFGEVTGLIKNAESTAVSAVRLADGSEIACGHLVNAAGPRAANIAQMAGIELAVEPRKRYSYLIQADQPLPAVLPLTVDPSGVHMHERGGGTYLIGGHTSNDPAVDPDDFLMDHSLWETHFWPAIAARIPQFERVKVLQEWVGHYAYHVLDQNAVIGPHPHIENFIFMNGFSGHGLQQAPAMGRGVAEWILYGGYRSLDLSPFHYDRIIENRPFGEQAVI